jgi:hypothetical protein
MDNPPVHHGQGYLHLAAIGLLHALPNGLIQPQGTDRAYFVVWVIARYLKSI